MAPMSGVDLLNEIHRNAETKRPSVILMSARKEPEWILAGKKTGADCVNHETVQRWHVEDKNHSAWLVELSASRLTPLRPANEEQLSMA
jgi:CheY-like chemotaxis protein